MTYNKIGTLNSIFVVERAWTATTAAAVEGALEVEHEVEVQEVRET